MQSTSTSLLRNIVLLSHSGAGKTSLAEACIFATGTISRMGKVEDGNTVSDYEPEEIKRGGSTQLSLVPCNWNQHKLNLIDTPGYADFLAEVSSGIRVADGAVLVLAAPAGIEAGTEEMWKTLEKESISRIIVVNKMDRENADFSHNVMSLQEKFGRNCVPTHWPIWSDAIFKDVIDLLEDGKEYPANLGDAITAARDQLIEVIAESDDELATKYLEGEEIKNGELRDALARGVISGLIVPILPASATLGIGVKEILNSMSQCLPSPSETDRNSSSGTEGLDGSGPEGSFAALVFKTTADPYVGKVSYFRVYSGSVQSDTQVWNTNKEQAERVGQLFTVNGKNQEQVARLDAGDIGAVGKLSSTTTGDTLCQKETPWTLPGIRFPDANHTVAVYPKSKQDVDKMSSTLTRIAEEDPSLRISREPNTGEILLTGLGDTHVEIAEEKIRRKFGTDLVLQIPKVPYRETITIPTKVEYKHKKQSGGHGQYGHVLLELEPLSGGTGFEFASKVVGGSVPREYFPAVEKGIVKSLDEGSVAGYPVVGVKVVLYDGSFHPVDSSGMSFEIAGGHAFRKGLSMAGPVLLEPVMRAQITVPDSFTGEVTGDLNTKRARILGMTPEEGYTVIDVDVPQAEMLRYSTDLRSLTQGKGRYFMEFDHYDQVPAHMSQKVVEDAKRVAG